MIRRKAGQDAGKIKEDLKKKEMEKEAARAKRGQSIYFFWNSISC